MNIKNKRGNACLALMMTLVMMLSACTSTVPENSNSEDDVKENNISVEPRSSEINSDRSIHNENTVSNQNVTVTLIRWRRVIGSKIWYEVSYRLEEGGDVQEGYMNTDGVISTEEPPALYESESSYMTTLGAVDEGIYLAQEVNYGIDGGAVYLGLIDNTGNWVSEKINLPEVTGVNLASVDKSAFENLGDGMLAAHWFGDKENYLFVFDTKTKNVITIPSVSQSSLDFGFYEGSMIFQQRTGGSGAGKIGDICSVDRDGTITTLPAEGNLLAVGENGFLTNSNGISFYTRSGELVWTFNDYELSDEVTPVVYSNMVFVGLVGKDSWHYVGCLSQESGTLVYEPLRLVRDSIFGHVMVTGSKFIDLLTGETLAEVEPAFRVEDIEYYDDGFFIIRDAERESVTYRFYDESGNVVQPVLSIK